MDILNFAENKNVTQCPNQVMMIYVSVLVLFIGQKLVY